MCYGFISWASWSFLLVRLWSNVEVYAFLALCYNFIYSSHGEVINSPLSLTRRLSGLNLARWLSGSLATILTFYPCTPNQMIVASRQESALELGSLCTFRKDWEPLRWTTSLYRYLGTTYWVPCQWCVLRCLIALNWYHDLYFYNVGSPLCNVLGQWTIYVGVVWRKTYKATALAFYISLWAWRTIDLGNVMCILLFTNLSVLAVVVVKPSDVCRGISENKLGLS